METLIRLFVLWLVFLGLLAFFAWYIIKCLTIVKEGTKKVVVLFGAFDRVLDPGLRFVGIWPFYRVYKYWFRRTSVKKDGTFEEHPKELLDYVLTKDDVHGCMVKEAEDKNLVPLTWLLALTIRIVDPRKALFEIENWNEALLKRISPYVRDFSTLYSFEDMIQKDMKLEKKILEKLRVEGIIEEFRTRYGIDIRKLEVLNVEPDPKYREAVLKKWSAEREAEKRVASTIGALMSMIVNQTGADLKEVQNEFKVNPDATLKKYAGLIELNRDFITRQMGLDAGAVRQYYFHGGQGGLDLIALLGDVFRGGGNPGGQGGGQQGGQAGQGGKSVEEAAQEFFDKRGVWPHWDPLKRKPSV
jgi:regulator of protease activity HflC (stomatin/prohibitin superfamily)